MEIINLWHRIEKTAQEELKKYPGGTLDTRNGMYRIILKDKVEPTKGVLKPPIVEKPTPEEIMKATDDMIKKEEVEVKEPVEIKPPVTADKVVVKKARISAPSAPALPGSNTL